MPGKKLFNLTGKEWFYAAGFLLAVILLPVVIWMTLRDVSSGEMRKQSREISTAISDLRQYYSDNVIDRLQKSGGRAVPSDGFRDVHGGIPIPATFSIEIGEIFNKAHTDTSMGYAFVSDYPFTSRERDKLDNFQSRALEAFRKDQNLKVFEETTAPLIGQSIYRFATPVVMTQACVNCHNSHPNSTRSDWKAGDIRGIQDISLSGMETNISTYRNLFFYIVFLTFLSIGAAVTFKRNADKLEGLNRDLKDAKEYEAQISHQLRDKVQQLALLGAVADNSTFGISIADATAPDMPLVYVNPAFTKITGYSKEESVGQNCRFMKGPETSQEELKGIREALLNAQAHTVELLNYHKSGRPFWNRLTLFPVGGTREKPDFIVGYQIDVTAIHEAAIEREAMMVEIQENQKLESLGIMVAGVAHEINNPLGIALTAATHISQAAATMKKHLASTGKLEAEVADFLEEEEDAFTLIYENLKRAASLVTNFKNVAVDSTHDDTRRIDLREYLDMTVSTMRPILRRTRCKLNLEVADGIVTYVKTGSFGQLITNLVVNATVHAFDNIPSPIIDIRAEVSNQDIIISVADNGNGIPRNMLAEIFTPFFTSKRTTGSTGLGLYIARKIATDTLHGSLTVENQIDGGAIFTLRFPIQSTAT